MFRHGLGFLLLLVAIVATFAPSISAQSSLGLKSSASQPCDQFVDAPPLSRLNSVDEEFVSAGGDLTLIFDVPGGGSFRYDSDPDKSLWETGQLNPVPFYPTQAWSFPGGACPPNPPGVVEVGVCTEVRNSNDEVIHCCCEVSLNGPGWGAPALSNSRTELRSYPSGYYIADTKGDGVVKYTFWDQNENLAPFIEIRGFNGEITRFELVDDLNNLRKFRIAQFVDAHDNHTFYRYDSLGRLSVVDRPDGISENWNYAPSWIGNGGWSSTFYSGAEITYTDNLNGGALLADQTHYLLFHKTGGGPFLGDRLYRRYLPRSLHLSDPPVIGVEPFDVSTAAAGHQVYEFSYKSGVAAALIEKISHTVAPSVLPATGLSKVDLRSYQYALIGGRQRVVSEVVHSTSQTYTYSYVVDPLDASRVDERTRTSVHNHTVHHEYDDHARVVTMTYTPTNDPAGRPRTVDPAANGAVSPMAITVNYTYGACGGCKGKPTRIEYLPSGRIEEFDYDPVTGYLLEERAPDPRGGTGLVATKYVWEPMIAGDPLSRRKLVSVEDPAQHVWTYNYNLEDRYTPTGALERGKLVKFRTETLPAVAAATPPLPSVLQYDDRPPQFDAVDGWQSNGLVGQLVSSTDHDGITTRRHHDGTYGWVTKLERNPNAGADTVTTDFVPNRFGYPLSIVANATSTIPHTQTLTYTPDHKLQSISAQVGAQAVASERYYDRWGALCVLRRKNENSAGLPPADLESPGNPESGRPWVERQFHRSIGVLVAELVDRRALDRAAASAAPYVDDQDAHFSLTTFAYSASGQVTHVGMPNGATRVRTYDGYGSLYRERIAYSGSADIDVKRVFVNAELEPVRVVEGSGALELARDITRNHAGYVTSITDPDFAPPAWYTLPVARAVTEFDIDILGRVAERSVRDHSSTQVLEREAWVFDSIGRITSTSTFEDVASASTPNETVWDWDRLSHVATVADGAGRVQRRYYDALGRLTRMDDGLAAGASSIEYSYLAGTYFADKVTERSFDDHPNVGAEVIRETYYSYDSLGRRVQVQEGGPLVALADRLTHSYKYYSLGWVEEYADPSGKLRRSLPDALGRVREVLEPGVVPRFSATNYVDWTGSAGASRVERVAPTGLLTLEEYDFAGRLRLEMLPGSSALPDDSNPSKPFARYYSYDEASRVVSVTQGDNAAVNYVRDGVGRVLARSTPEATGLNPAVSFFFGRDILAWDARGVLNYTASLSGANGAAGAYIEEFTTVDPAGRRVSESFKFSAAPNTVQVGSGLTPGDNFRKSLTVSGGLSSIADDLTIEYGWDLAGRLRTVDAALGGSALSQLASYSYDGSAVRRRVTRWGNQPLDQYHTDFEYDSFGRVTGIDHSFDPAAGVAFVFDDANNLVKEVYQKVASPAAVGDRFGYDEHHQLLTAWLGSDAAHMVAPDPAAGVGGFDVGVTYLLDPAGNLQSVDEQAGQGGAISSTAYVTQSAGDPQGASNRYQSVGGEQLAYDSRGNTVFDGNYYYVYDVLNRLTEVYLLVGDDSAAQAMLQSGADVAELGCRECGRGAFTVKSLVDLQVARSAIVRALGGVSVSASAPHAVARSGHTCAPLPRNSVFRVAASATSPSPASPSPAAAQQSADGAELVLVAVYLYDYQNRRVGKIVPAGATSFFVWDDWSEVAELGLGVDAGAPNGPVVALVPKRQFVWGERLDELVAFRSVDPSSSGWFYIGGGGADCPARVLDSGGQVVEVQEYGAYGSTTYFPPGGGAGSGQSSPAVGNPYAWKAHRRDVETGLLYARNRFYSPALRRFLTPDPLGLWADGRNHGNGYAYAGNNPLLGSDPFGLQSTIVFYSNGDSFNALVFNKDGEKKLVTRHKNSFHPMERMWPTVNVTIGDNSKCWKDEFNAGDAYAGNLTPNDLTRVDHKLLDLKRQYGDERLALLFGMFGGIDPTDAIFDNLLMGSTEEMLDQIDEMDGFDGDPDDGPEHSKKTNGNSKKDKRAQHVYVIIDNDTGEVAKYGISGQPENKNGTSPRANRQVNKLNKDEGRVEKGKEKYRAEIVDRVPAGKGAREKALRKEKARVVSHVRRWGKLPSEQKLPKPSKRRFRQALRSLRRLRR